jgi:hypothetical protein
MRTAADKIRVIGRREFVDFPDLGLYNLEAKIDTGAYTSSIHCKDIILKTVNGKQVLYFTLLDESHPEYSQKSHESHDFTRKKIKNSFGEMEERYVIRTLVRLERKKIKTTISLSDREHMRYPVLIGRRMIKGKFIVDVNKMHTHIKKKKK